MLEKTSSPDGKTDFSSDRGAKVDSPFAHPAMGHIQKHS
jgi:hypothetical protein